MCVELERMDSQEFAGKGRSSHNAMSKKRSSKWPLCHVVGTLRSRVKIGGKTLTIRFYRKRRALSLIVVGSIIVMEGPVKGKS